MNTLTHPVAPEEIMALLDNELTAAEAQSIAQHIDQCADCAALRDELQNTSQALARWTTEPLPESVDTVIAHFLADERTGGTPNSRAHSAVPPWALAARVALIIAVVALSLDTYLHRTGRAFVEKKERGIAIEVGQSAIPVVSRLAGGGGGGGGDLTVESAATMNQFAGVPRGIVGGVAPSSQAPMIARTVSLTILVKNIAASRATLDTILAQHHGYAAQLTINTPEAGSRSFQSSLRVPAPDLASALDALRTLGRVQTETQSGEEVTQQHTDLVARLTNAREAETRLRDILVHRVGKMEDVLEVEEKISETRGEIEQLEAEQKSLEHRVDFASVDLTLAEEYKAQLGDSSASVGTRMHNSFIDGLRTAGASLVNVVLFIEEAGPVLLIWIAILGTPILLLWRRYRRARTLIP
jgi:anti-sigma factor RsiW